MIKTLQTDIRFDGAQTTADYANDPIQHPRAVAVVKFAQWRGFGRLRQSFGFLDCFHDGQDKTVRRIDAMLKYWPGQVQWIIDGLEKSESVLGDLAPYLQRLIDKSAVRTGTSFSFGELDGKSAAADLARYEALASRVNWRGKQVFAPPVAVYPGNDWEGTAKLILSSKWVARGCYGVSHNTYGRTIDEALLLASKVDNLLRTTGKKVTQQEAGASTVWTGLKDQPLGVFIGKLEKGLIERGADFGIYGWLEEPGVPDEARFSISRETVLQGYLSV